MLTALKAALAEPGRLVALLQEAEDDDAAVASISEGLGIPADQASAVLDQQFRLLVRSRRAALAEEVRVLRAPWQEPLEVSVEISPPDSAVLVLDGTEHRFTGRRVPELLDAVTGFLRERIVDPDLRPVVGKDPVLLTPRRLGASLGTGPPHYLTATPSRPRRRARARRGRTACGRR